MSFWRTGTAQDVHSMNSKGCISTSEHTLAETLLTFIASALECVSQEMLALVPH